MATTFDAVWARPVARDRGFFFAMALATAGTTIAGFVLAIAMRHSSFGAPWWVHVHGVTMMGWLALYVIQNALVWRGQVSAHRSLGMVGAAWSVWVVAVGATTNTWSAMTHRVPPFFETNTFLAMDYLTVATFAGLVWAGIALRGRSDWHRRLMLCAAIQVMTPGIGRLVPLPLIAPGWQIGVILACLVPFMLAALLYDLTTRGRIHPAYGWGFGAIIGAAALMRPLAFTPPMLALTKAIAG